MDAIERSLIKEILNTALVSRTGVNAKEFRAGHEDYLDVLDRLEQGPYIERRDDLYRIRLLTLAELRDDDSRVEAIIRQCDKVFCFLRPTYKDRTGVPITLAEIAQKTDIPEFELRLALSYMTDAPIWGGYTSDLLRAQEVMVVPGESILRYKTFDSAVQQLRDWAARHPTGGSSPGGDQSVKPLFLREADTTHLRSPSDFPKWYANLPEKIHDMLREVRYALQKELRALPSMGLRAVVDMICNDQVGDTGGFKEKLHKLEEKRLITPKKREIIEAALEVGHASMHRGHFPPAEHLDIVLDIVDHLLEELYVLDKASDSLSVSVPRRHSKKNE